MDDELAALADSGAAHLDAPAVHLDQLLDQVEPYPQAPLGALEAGVDLGEHVEQPGKVLGRDADAVVRDLNDGVSVLHPDGEPDPASPRRELAGVAQEVGDRLRDPHAVAVDIERPVRDLDVEHLLVVSAQRAADLERLLEGLPQVHSLPLERELSAADPGDIEEVFDQPHQVHHLALDRRLRRRRGVCVAARVPEDSHRVADRRERIADLVRQHGEKLVLAAVGFGELAGELSQLLGRGPLLADVAEDGHHAGDPAL